MSIEMRPSPLLRFLERVSVVSTSETQYFIVSARLTPTLTIVQPAKIVSPLILPKVDWESPRPIHHAINAIATSIFSPFDTLIVQNLLQEVKRVMFGGGCTEFRQLQRTTKIIINTITTRKKRRRRERRKQQTKREPVPYCVPVVFIYRNYLILIWYASSSYSLFVLGVNRTETAFNYYCALCSVQCNIIME